MNDCTPRNPPALSLAQHVSGSLVSLELVVHLIIKPTGWKWSLTYSQPSIAPFIVSIKMALCTTAHVFRIEHNCTKEFWSSVLCKLSTYGRVSHCERWEEDARTSQNLYHYLFFLLFDYHILNLHPAFSFVSTITTVVPQISLDIDAIDACRIWMTIYCRLYFTFHLHIHFRRLFLHLLNHSDVLGPSLLASDVLGPLLQI